MLTRAGRHLATDEAGVEQEAGFSLIELLVTMTMMLFVGAIATGILVAVNKQSANTTSQSLAASRARVALSSVISLLQNVDTPTNVPGAADNRFDVMTATKVQFYSDVNNRSGQTARSAPVKVVLQFTGTQLTEALYQPTSATGSGTGNYPTNPTTTNILLGGDSSTLASGSTFSYCSGAAPSNTTGACTATTTAAQVASVGITVVMAGPGTSTQTFAASTAVPGVVSS